MEKGLEQNGSNSNLTQQVSGLDENLKKKIDAEFFKAKVAIDNACSIINKNFGIVNPKNKMQSLMQLLWDNASAIEFNIDKQRKNLHEIFKNFK